MEAQDWIERLGLVPLKFEGGYFRETYRSGHATAIYYLLTKDTCSAMHRLHADEMFHFYAGDPVEMLQIGETAQVVRLDGEHPQVLVPRGTWQGSRLVPGGAYALMGTTMAPPFDRSGFERGDRAALVARCPEHRGLIEALTP